MKVSVLSLKEKATQHCSSYFQIACKYIKSFMTNPLNIILKILVYDNSNIGPSSVVYIFHKGIISLVLCSYESQMNMYIFILSESLPLMQFKLTVDRLRVRRATSYASRTFVIFTIYIFRNVARCINRSELHYYSYSHSYRHLTCHCRSCHNQHCG